MVDTSGNGQRKSFGAILLDCAIAALITFVIAAPIMGLRTVNAPGGMTLDQHWGKVLAAVLVVFFGRLGLQLFAWNRAEGSGFGRLVLRLVLAAIIGFAVGSAVCFLTLGSETVSPGEAMENALLTVPWNIATLLFAIAVFSLSYGMFPRFPRQAGGAEAPAVAGALAPVGDLLKLALLVIAIALPFLPWSDRYILDLGILILTYIMLGWGLNVVVGLAGLLDLGYVAFYAVGAYAYALLATVYFPLWFPSWLIPFSFWIALPLAGVLAAMWGIMLGFPVLRLRGDYLAIVTLAFGEIIRVILVNWADFTGGPNGISGIPRPTFFGIPLDSSEQGFAARMGIPYAPIQRIIFLYYIILGLALVTNAVTLRLRTLPLGRAWEALREDEIACRSLGINTTNTKLTAFAIGAMFGGFAGSFFATRQGFISPESFVFMESALILAIVVLGGLGSQIGVVISAIVMIGGFEAFRNLDFLRSVFGPDFDPAQYRMIVFGLAMVSIMIWRPRGLVTRREPSIYLKERKAVSGELVAEGRG